MCDEIRWIEISENDIWFYGYQFGMESEEYDIRIVILLMSWWFEDGLTFSLISIILITLIQIPKSIPQYFRQKWN